MTANNCINSSYSKNLTPYIVGSDTALYQYQSIQTAITQAESDGASSTNPQVVLVSPGSHAGGFTIKDGIIVRGMNSTPGFHSTRINGDVVWGGDPGTEGALENVTVHGNPSALVTIFSESTGGKFTITDCLLDASGGALRCVHNQLGNGVTINIVRSTLIKGSNEHILLNGANSMDIQDSNLIGGPTIRSSRFLGSLTNNIRNCFIVGRVESDLTAVLNISQTKIDAFQGTGEGALRAFTTGTITADDCHIITNTIPAIFINDGATCNVLGCTLETNSATFAIANLGGAGTSILNKANIIMSGSNALIDPLMVVTTYPVL